MRRFRSEELKEILCEPDAAGAVNVGLLVRAAEAQPFQRPRHQLGGMPCATAYKRLGRRRKAAAWDRLNARRKNIQSL